MSGHKRITWLHKAVADVARVCEFIRVNNPAAAGRAGRPWSHNIPAHPSISRPVLDIECNVAFQDVFIPFAQGGYWLRYAVTDDEIIIVRLWHGREDRNK